MTDIVERLRSRDPTLHVGAMCHQAADEIERLRKEVVWLRQLFDDSEGRIRCPQDSDSTTPSP